MQQLALELAIVHLRQAGTPTFSPYQRTWTLPSTTEAITFVLVPYGLKAPTHANKSRYTHFTSPMLSYPTERRHGIQNTLLFGQALTHSLERLCFLLKGVALA